MFPSDAPPRALAGFEVLQRLGTGGVGDVYLARSRAGKLVAIKTVADPRRSTDEDETIDAFAREASVCVRLRHPCIVQVRAFIEDAGFAAIVFEYVPGVALARMLRLCQGSGVRLPDNAAWHIVERVLSALAYAHGFSDGGVVTPIVHRDISPSNVLLDWSGGVKIADFGIAKVLGQSSRTRVGVVKGTPGCMSPEQARGDEVDERADVYAAALLAWRLATGRAPFGKHYRDEWELMRAMRNPKIPPIATLRPDLPEPLLDAIACALEPERNNRSITAAQLADVVRRQVDLKAGWVQLGELLEAAKGALERGVKRMGDGTRTTGVGHDQTLRYEEVALAFDDEPAEDGPTFEAHALPSDPSVLVASPPSSRRPAPAVPPESAGRSSAATPSDEQGLPEDPAVPPEIADASNLVAIVDPDRTVPPRSRRASPRTARPLRLAPRWVRVALIATVGFIALGLLALAIVELSQGR